MLSDGSGCSRGSWFLTSSAPMTICSAPPDRADKILLDIEADEIAHADRRHQQDFDRGGHLSPHRPSLQVPMPPSLAHQFLRERQRPRDTPIAAGPTSFKRPARSRPSAGTFSGNLPSARATLRIAEESSWRLRSGRSVAATLASKPARLRGDTHSVCDILRDDMNVLVMTLNDPSMISLFSNNVNLPG